MILFSEGSYFCESCQSGKLPIAGEIIWVKLGTYRWWPSQVMHPGKLFEQQNYNNNNNNLNKNINICNNNNYNHNINHNNKNSNMTKILTSVTTIATITTVDTTATITTLATVITITTMQ